MNETIKQEIELLEVGLYPRPGMEEIHNALAAVAQAAYDAGRSDAVASLMTADEVAEHLGVTRRRVYALIANRQERGLVEPLKIGNQVVVWRDDLEALAPDEKYRR